MIGASARPDQVGRRERVIDIGGVEGRLFVNAAGIGLDAQVAVRSNARRGCRRGLWPYIRIGAHELLRHRARKYALHPPLFLTASDVRPTIGGWCKARCRSGCSIASSSPSGFSQPR